MSFPPSHQSFPPMAFQPEPLLAVACPTCFGAIAVGNDVLGKAAECPLCGSGFQVPLPGVADTPRGPTPVAAAATAAVTTTAPAERSGKHRRGPTTEPSTEAAVVQPAAESPSAAPGPQTAPRAELQFQEPVRTVGSGDQVITLRRLTPEEKAVRRARRNLMMMVTGVSILMAIVLLLGTKRTKRRG